MHIFLGRRFCGICWRTGRRLAGRSITRSLLPSIGTTSQDTTRRTRALVGKDRIDDTTHRRQFKMSSSKKLTCNLRQMFVCLGSPTLLDFCLGWSSNFVGSKSGQIQSVKPLQNMVSYRTPTAKSLYRSAQFGTANYFLFLLKHFVVQNFNKNEQVDRLPFCRHLCEFPNRMCLPGPSFWHLIWEIEETVVKLLACYLTFFINLFRPTVLEKTGVSLSFLRT